MLHNKDIFEKVVNCDLFIDTNVLIGALYLEDLRSFLHQLKSNGCSIMSVPGVAIEFYRGSKKLSKDIVLKDLSPQGYRSRAEFYKNIVDSTYPIEKHLDEMEEFIVIAHNTNQEMEFTDITLAACLYYFKNSNTYLMTSNTQHFSSEIFHREFILTPESGKGVMNYCLYSFSKENFNKASENILKSSKNTHVETRTENVDSIPF